VHHFIIGLALCLSLLGCNDDRPQSPSDNSPMGEVITKIYASNSVPFTGRVVYQNIEGGFWGIITDDGKKLDCAVPKFVRFDNQKVSGSYRLTPNMTSFRMWGSIADVTALKPIGPIIKTSKNEY